MATAEPLPIVFEGLQVTDAVRSGREYHAACPSCGGRDRLVMWEKSQATGGALAWCRKCDFKWWPGKDESVWQPLTDEEKEAIAQERARRTAEERAEIERNRAAFAETATYQVFYENLQRYPRGRELWYERYGITDWSLQYYRLGYCPRFEYFHKNEAYASDSLTIPYFTPQTNYHPINLRHRLLTPDAPGGKYRPHKAGLGQPIFYANLNRDPLAMDYVLIVEGGIKAMLLWQTITAVLFNGPMDAVDWWLVKELAVIGIPGGAIHDRNLPLFETAKRIVLFLDPDAYQRVKPDKPTVAERMAAKLGQERCHYITLPGKPDDMILNGSLTVRDLYYFIHNARRA